MNDITYKVIVDGRIVADNIYYTEAEYIVSRNGGVIQEQTEKEYFNEL